MRKAIIFGTSGFAELVHFYLENDADYEIVAFTETKPQMDVFLDRPVVAFDEVEKLFSPQDHEMFVAVGYRKMNALRKEFCEQARLKGYHLLSYISSKATYWDKKNTIGDNVFIFEDNTIQPFVKIGDGTILWSGNHIGHHSSIGEYCFISSQVVVSGFCEVGDQSFLGVNATLADTVYLGKKVLIGAGALVTSSLSEETVVSGQKGKIIGKKSSFFMK